MIPDEIDPYEILQVPHNATEREIKVAYKKLALQNHPDRCSNPDETKMALINEAYAILSDPERRRRYDLTQRLPAHNTNSNGVSSSFYNNRRDHGMRTTTSSRRSRYEYASTGSSTIFREDFGTDPFAAGRRRRNGNMSHFARDPFMNSGGGVGGLSNRSTGSGNKGFSFSSSFTSTNASGETKTVRKTTRYRDGKKETCVETVTVKPDGTRECETKVTSEDAVSLFDCNPFDKLLPQLNGVGQTLKKWIQGGGGNESSA